MSDLLEGLSQAREHIRNREWPKAHAILKRVFPTVPNSKYIGDCLRAGLGAMRDNKIDEAQELFWLAIDIYDCGRDENSEVITAIKILSDYYIKTGRIEDQERLSNRTFTLVIAAAEGMQRSIKSLTKQLNERIGAIPTPR
ncbi:MAG TPA: hypothetical protein V6C69_18225 [Trichormus sp.]